MQANPYFETVSHEWYRGRLIGAIAVIMVFFAVIFARVFHLQIVEGREYRQMSENNCIRIQTIEPSRGSIFDRNGLLLVDNRPAFDLCLIANNTHFVDQTLSRLCDYSGIDETEAFSAWEKRKKSSPFRPLLIKPDINRNVLAAVEVHQFDLPGIVVRVTPRRNYIYDGSAAHLIGYLGEISAADLQKDALHVYRGGDYIGKSGIERVYEEQLRGRRGGRQVEVDALGRVVRVIDRVDAEAGLNVYLTIDHDLQRETEHLLSGLAGAVVALNPATGEILAMASSPTFEQNQFVTGMSDDAWQALMSNSHRPMINKAVSGSYPPASTFKIITAMAGLEEGVIHPQFSVYCPGRYRLGNRVFRCWKKYGHGQVNVIAAIEQSCDVFFYQVGHKLGVDRIAEYAKKCGLGRPTGIDLPHENMGLVPSTAWKKRRYGTSWQKGETLSVAIGQGYDLATPLQLCVLTAAVANGGHLYRPVIVKKIVSPSGRLQSTGQLREQIGVLPVSEKNLKLIKRGLWQVVNGKKGTARLIQNETAPISGKTGTAQVVGRRKGATSSDEENLPDHLKPHAWFVGFAPADHPQIAVAVIIENGEHGSSSAAPVAAQVMTTYLKGDVAVR